MRHDFDLSFAPHGLPYLGANRPGTEVTVQTYMRLCGLASTDAALKALAMTFERLRALRVPGEAWRVGSCVAATGDDEWQGLVDPVG